MASAIGTSIIFCSFNFAYVSSSSKSATPSPCDICFRAKQTREVFPESFNKANDCFSLIHCDVWGPYRVPSSCGAVYFLTIVDDYSRAMWTYLLLQKSEVRNVLTNFIAYAEKQFGKTIKIVRSDNGTEFMCLSSHFKQQGIIHQTSCVATPQQNGRVERKHRHILNVARALLFQASLPIKFWGEAILTAAYLINCTPFSVNNGRSPYEILHNSKPPYDQLRVFGSACYVHRMARDKDKFGERSRLCIFVGYAYGKKGWKVYDLEKNEFFISRVVIFREDVFPYAAGDVNYVHVSSIQVIPDEDWLVPPSIVVRGSSESQIDSVPATQAAPQIDSVPATLAAPQNDSVPASPVLLEKSTSSSPVTITPPASPKIRTSSSSPTLAPLVDVLKPADSPHPIVELRRSKRERQESVRLKDYVAHKVVCSSETHHALPITASPSLSSSTV